MARKMIEEKWETYLDGVVPKEADYHQINETRKAFYSGAMLVYNIISEALNAGAELGEEEAFELAEETLRTLHEEVDAVFDLIEAEAFELPRH